MDVKRIEMEGRGRRPRNQRRVVVEVEHKTRGTLAGRHVLFCDVVDGRPVDTTQRLEFYEDELSQVLEKVITPEHRKAHRDAVRFWQNRRSAWLREHERSLKNKTPEERERFAEENFGLGPESFYSDVGFPKGIGTLSKAVVIPYDETSDLAPVDLELFLAMDYEERSPYCGHPPVTPDNAASHANNQLAEALLKLMEKMK